MWYLIQTETSLIKFLHLRLRDHIRLGGRKVGKCREAGSLLKLSHRNVREATDPWSFSNKIWTPPTEGATTNIEGASTLDNYGQPGNAKNIKHYLPKEESL